jgi:predicted metal-binding membrane protein
MDTALHGRALFGRDRFLPASLLLVLAALAWVGVILWARSSSMMDAMPGPVAPTRAALFAAMWLVMMAAMMLPAVTPIVLLFRTVQRARAARGKLAIPTSVFVSGYLAVWLAAGIAAFLVYALAQRLGRQLNADAGWLPYVGGAIVVLAGIYQFTPLKKVCLRHCRSPLHFLMEGFGEGKMGAFRTGATHGTFCLGCCWGIMAVLFVVGLMNLAWMAALSLVITVEKLAPRGMLVARGVGALFIVLGGLIAFRSSIFTPAGLAMNTGMSMGSQGMTMPAMHPTTNVPLHVYRAVAGPYLLTLSAGPAERMMTPAEAKSTHAHSGEVMLDGMGNMAMSGMAMSGMKMQRHLEVHVTDRAMGMPVTNAHLKVQLLRPGSMAEMVPVMRMYGAKEGMKDLHYGANLALSKGSYTVRMNVNGSPATVKLRMP